MSNLINDLQSLVPDYAKDIKLNIESVLNGSGGIDKEIDAPYIAFASAIATGNIKLIKISRQKHPRLYRQGHLNFLMQCSSCLLNLFHHHLIL